MTDNDIIKALECCIDCKCKECPCYKNIEGEMRCTEIDEEEILDLINRQKAEIERLQSLIKEADEYFSKGDFASGIAIIINLVKEMESEQ